MQMAAGQPARWARRSGGGVVIRRRGRESTIRLGTWRIRRYAYLWRRPPRRSCSSIAVAREREDYFLGRSRSGPGHQAAPSASTDFPGLEDKHLGRLGEQLVESLAEGHQVRLHAVGL